MEKLYTSHSDNEKISTFLQRVKHFVPIVSNDYCEDDISKAEISKALFSMKKGKSPGSDGLTIELYCAFRDLIENPLFSMYKECLEQKEMSSTMKQGVISLILKPDNDSLIIDNWRPITLLNVDYNILALIYGTRLKSGLSNIIGESKTGFMAKRHISSNIRLVLDILDYNHFVNSDALILFLDVYKAFDTIDHHFLLQSLHTFGFGNNFIQTVKMFYRGINSSVILQNYTSRRFFINRGVRQGCPISPFLFLIVVELLAIIVEKNPNLLGIMLFNREIKISQLADDTTLFLKDKNLIKNAIKLVQTFSDASGLQLTLWLCSGQIDPKKI